MIPAVHGHSLTSQGGRHGILGSRLQSRRLGLLPKGLLRLEDFADKRPREALELYLFELSEDGTEQ